MGDVERRAPCVVLHRRIAAAFEEEGYNFKMAGAAGDMPPPTFRP
jgi:hypothetical protein